MKDLDPLAALIIGVGTMIGAGPLRRPVSVSLAMDVADDVACSVLPAERARERSLRECLFGLGKE